MGAIASGGGRVINDEIVAQLGVDDETIEETVAEERAELLRRQRVYRGCEAPAAVFGRDVILVDDGLATGASMRAALDGVRGMDAARVTIAVPVGAPDTCAWFSQAADRSVCLKTPEPFRGVGQWYANFAQTSDEQVCELLARARG
jgi:putative phosphoribosyl transferase